MLVEESYQKYLLKVEKNGKNDNISTDRGRYVIIFNESLNKFVEFYLDNKNTDDIRYIQKLLISDAVLINPTKNKNHFDFKIPKNYLDLATVYAKASKNKCTDKTIYLDEIREENKTEWLQDDNYKPSFLWRTSFYNISEDNINVYFEDFEINSIILSYYKKPNKISLINPSDPESKFDETKQIEFEDHITDRIISLCAGEFSLNENDPIYQAQKQRVVSKL
jgi:hypothetical protein